MEFVGAIWFFNYSKHFKRKVKSIWGDLCFFLKKNDLNHLNGNEIRRCDYFFNDSNH